MTTKAGISESGANLNSSEHPAKSDPSPSVTVEDSSSKVEASETEPDSTAIEGSIYRQLLFGLSLPERAVRSTSAMVGGVLRESTSILVPQAFKSSKTYSIFVTQMIDILAHQIGGVKADENAPPSVSDEEGYVARKAVGNFVELAGVATVHLSPLTLLAIISDVAYGS
jgi:hypothetical protein